MFCFNNIQACILYFFNTYNVIYVYTDIILPVVRINIKHSDDNSLKS